MHAITVEQLILCLNLFYISIIYWELRSLRKMAEFWGGQVVDSGLPSKWLQERLESERREEERLERVRRRQLPS